MKPKRKVIILATSRKTRGGITAVLKAYEKGEQWHDYNCRWIATHRDGNIAVKLAYLFSGLIEFIVLISFYNIVHVNLSEPVSVKRKSIFIAVAKALGKKVIVHFHAGDADSTFNSQHKPLYLKIFSTADKLILLSPILEKKVKNTFPSLNNTTVVFNPCVTVPTAESFPKKKYILFAGTLNERKGFLDMITAFAPIAKDFADWKLVFAGNGEIDKGKALAKQLGIENQTEFIGWVNGPDKDRIFKESTIFCLPSYAEGFPMAVLDAWAFGLPVITTPVGGIPDIAKDGENLLLFNPGDTSKLTECFKKMITDNDLRNNIANESKQLSETTFSLDTINRQIADIYHNI